MAFNLADVLKDVPDSGTIREQIAYVRIDLLDEDPHNFYQLTGIDDLAANIELCGLQQPIRVRATGNGRYRIVSGHRRRKALEILAQENPERWNEVPCIIETDEISPALQQLRLIYANANTRKMSPAETGEQAEQVEKLLYQLKEEGYEFPGRMRDHVAEAVNISKSKLSRLKVIRTSLAAVWVDAFKTEQIGESVAYALAQMPEPWQTIIHNVWGGKPRSLYADYVTSFRDRFQKLAKLQCKQGLTLCEHTMTMMEKSCKEPYCAACTECCFTCSNLQTCKNCCPEAIPKQKELKASARKADLDAKLAQEEKDRPGADFARLVYKRIGEARLEGGISVKTLMEAQKKIYSESIDVPKQSKMENGEGIFSSNTYLPFGCNVRACDLMGVVAVADALRVSVDYLLGRTERMELVPESGTTASRAIIVPESGTSWQTGEPLNLGAYAVILDKCQFNDVRTAIFQWTGLRWEEGGIGYDEDIDGTILGWIPMPEGIAYG